MLVVEWEALYGAIPRIHAQEQLAAFLVASTAQPAGDWRGVRQKQSIIDGWREQMAGAMERVSDSVRRIGFRELARVLDRVSSTLAR